MKERHLTISGDLWLSVLKSGSEQHFRVIKNGLPEDARAVRVEPVGNNFGECRDVRIVITSSVFQDSDPEELPSPTLQSLYPVKGEYKPFGE